MRHLKFLLLIIFFSCHYKNDKEIFQLVENTGIDFKNEVTDGKLENSFLFRNFYNGGGVAIGDINNDGLSDVFLTSNMGENKLYLNKGNFKFEDITASAGFKQDSLWCTGVVFVDINNDGWLDIYVSSSGHMTNGRRKNKLYINNHNKTFTEEAAKYGLDVKAYTTQVSFFDYDNDGDLDCFMINNSPIPINTLNNANRRDLPEAQWPVAQFLKGGGDHLFKNDDGHFSEVTKEAGIHGSLISFGLGASVGDLNNDGYPDIYVSNDSYERDYLYINQKNGTFKDELEERMEQTSFSSMGADIADINNDGYPEVFTTDMLPGDDYRLKTTGSFDNIDLFQNKLNSGFYYQYVKNCLQLNNKNGKFCDIANYCGVSATDWSWGALMFDADNDGLNDIYICNGVNRDVTNLDFMDFFANDVIQKMVLTGKKEGVDDILKKIPKTPLLNKMYRNLGNLQFADAGADWGLTQTSFSNGAAYGDLDNDGDLDLIVNNENQQAFIYKNTSREKNKNHFIGITLKGKDKNTFAIGSKIKIYEGSQILSREVIPSRGFESSVDYKQIIGLGTAQQIDSMVIIWPDRTSSKYIYPAIDTVHLIAQGDNTGFLTTSDTSTLSVVPLLQPVKNIFDRHEEDDYTDFYYERNIPEMLSRQGPKAAYGDVNGDGLTDVYIGGTSKHAGQLYLQTNNGFVKNAQKSFIAYSDFEDEAVLFFDCDGDGDPDLYIGAGGNNMSPHTRQSQHRLFKNDGKGNFEIDRDAFPENDMNIGAACAYDFDHDGDLDLFVGGRSVPGNYGISPTSYIYVNDGHGHFSDMAKIKNPDIAAIGMVTGAVWADVAGDKEKELVITGEWMTPRIFSFNHDHFVEIKSNLDNLFGLWQTVAAADVNGDGKEDLLLGNFGENFYLRPNEKNPVKIWINDFDKNGTIDKVLTRTIDGKDMPVFLKHDIDDQMPALKKENLLHEIFAKKSVQDLFSEDLLKQAVMKTFNYPASCIAVNKGNGQFTIQKMPAMAQLSSVNAIVCTDVNGDGYPDLVMGGNNSGFLPQFGRLDASFGTVALNNGKGQFTCLDPDHSGVDLRGEVRDIVQLGKKNGKYFLFLRNNDFPALFNLSKTITTK